MTGPGEVTQGYLDVEGGRLYYEVAGQGHPLVLIHAGVGDRTMWDDQWGPFAQRYRVIRYDTRGFGKTTTEDVSFSDRQDLYDLLKYLGVEKTHLLGASRSGRIAIDFTLEHPEMVDALITLAAGFSGYQGAPNEEEMRLFDQVDELEQKQDFAALTDLEVRIWVDGFGRSGQADPNVRERVREMVLTNYERRQPEGKPVGLKPPAAGRLSEIKVPTLVIVGDHDVSATQDMAVALEEGIPVARRVVFPGTAHMLNMERPEEFNRVVLDFLGDLK